MSTRSEIIIKENLIYDNKKYKFEIKLYHHHDGYPEGVGRFLIEEVLPQLQKSNPSCEEIANFLIKHPKDDEFEVTIRNHVDIEYRYVIDISKKEIKCYEGRYHLTKKDNYVFCADRVCDLTRFQPLQKTELYN